MLYLGVLVAGDSQVKGSTSGLVLPNSPLHLVLIDASKAPSSANKHLSTPHACISDVASKELLVILKAQDDA